MNGLQTGGFPQEHALWEMAFAGANLVMVGAVLWAVGFVTVTWGPFWRMMSGKGDGATDSRPASRG